MGPLADQLIWRIRGYQGLPDYLVHLHHSRNSPSTRRGFLPHCWSCEFVQKQLQSFRKELAPAYTKESKTAYNLRPWR